MLAVGQALSLLPQQMDTPAARVMLYAIGLQESNLKHRWQVTDPKRPEHMGPARGLWQFERGGGVAGVMAHKASAKHAEALCHHFGVAPNTYDVYGHLHLPEYDALAAGLARLLLWTDPAPLPAVGESIAAFAIYTRVWRPGAFHRGTPTQRESLRRKWAYNYETAVGMVGA